jgi:transaldolase
MLSAADLKIKLFADGADKATMLEMYRNPLIQGFTTNPTLMRKAGICDYASFARDVIEAIPDRPISFEVFADDFGEMERQARIIAGWGPNVNAKIPITNTKGEPCFDLVRKLTREGIQLNITALLTLDQVRCVAAALRGGAPAFVSVFAGRIADAGLDPIPIMSASLEEIADLPGVELIWASPRELLNVVQADAIGCHVITATSDILKKLSTLGKDLTQFSLETVQMFHEDARSSGFML